MSTVGNHRIVHGLLTAMLALGYAAVVIYLAGLLSIVGRGSGLAVAIAALVVAACCGQPGGASRVPWIDASAGVRLELAATAKAGAMSLAATVHAPWPIGHSVDKYPRNWPSSRGTISGGMPPWGVRVSEGFQEQPTVGAGTADRQVSVAGRKDSDPGAAVVGPILVAQLGDSDRDLAEVGQIRRTVSLPLPVGTKASGCSPSAFWAALTNVGTSACSS
jgi:hypothetical protein